MADGEVVMHTTDFIKRYLEVQQTWLCATILPLFIFVDESGHSVVKLPSAHALDVILGKCGGCGSVPVRLDSSELDRMVSGIPPIQPEPTPLDLTDPHYAIAADPAQLRVLSDDDKSLLRHNIKAFRRELWDQFSQEQRWAFNADATPIPIRDRSATSGPSVYHVAHSTTEAETRLHLSSSAKDRWYVIVKGQGFTGIARGTEFYFATVTGVPRAYSEKATSKSEAEVLWLRYHANGATEVLPDAAPRQSPTPAPVAAANTLRTRYRAPARVSRTGPMQRLFIDLDSGEDEDLHSDANLTGERVTIDLTNANQFGKSVDQEMD